MMVADNRCLSRRGLLPSLVFMTDEQQRKGRRAIENGPTGQAVADRLAALRKVRGLTTRQLSAAVARVGRPIPASGITRMERGERMITVDDLMAFSVVLGVSPAALLLPLEDDPAKTAAVTGAGEVPADTAWAWLSNERPIRLPDGDTRTALLEYQLYSLPPGRRALTSHVLGNREEFVKLPPSVLIAALEQVQAEFGKEMDNDGPGVD